MDNPFAVGDKVTVMGAVWNRTAVGSITEVVSVDKKSITLADGRRWNADGRQPYGSKNRFYTGSYVVRWKPEHDEALRRRILIERLAGFGDWEKLTTAELETAWKLICSVAERREDGR